MNPYEQVLNVGFTGFPDEEGTEIGGKDHRLKPVPLRLHSVQDDRRAVARLSIMVVIEAEARDPHHPIDARDGVHQIIELSGAAHF